MIEVKNKIRVYEINGEDVDDIKEINIEVSSHWNYNNRINIIIDKKKYTVIAKDLKAAIDNAINVNPD